MSKRPSKKKSVRAVRASRRFPVVSVIGGVIVLGVAVVAVVPLLSDSAGTTKFSAAPGHLSFDIIKTPVRSGTGIRIENTRNVTMKDVTVAGFANGIVENNSENIEHENVQVR